MLAHATADRALTTTEPGERCTIRRVSDRDPHILRHLADLGVTPGKHITVTEVVPFGGGVRFRLGREQRLLGRDAADAVFVA